MDRVNVHGALLIDLVACTGEKLLGKGIRTLYSRKSTPYRLIHYMNCISLCYMMNAQY